MAWRWPWRRTPGGIRRVTRALVASLTALDAHGARGRLDRMIARTRQRNARTWDFGHGMTETRIDGRDLATTMHLAPGIVIRGEVAEIDHAVWDTIPSSVQIALVGRRLSELLGHPALSMERVLSVDVSHGGYRPVRIGLGDVWLPMRVAHGMIEEAKRRSDDDE